MHSCRRNSVAICLRSYDIFTGLRHYVECLKPIWTLRDHDAEKIKIQTTRNQRVYQSPYTHGVQLWKRLPVEIRTITNRKFFLRNIHGLLLA